MTAFMHRYQNYIFAAAAFSMCAKLAFRHYNELLPFLQQAAVWMAR